MGLWYGHCSYLIVGSLQLLVIVLSGCKGVSLAGIKDREQLTVFADAVPRVKPLVFFRGMRIGGGVVKEMESYDPRVVVKFNMKTYANTENFLQWIDEQLIPVLDNQPTLLALDLFAAHKTQEVLDTFLANDIAVSLIPGGCTSLVQPLDISINRPFKDILKVM